jgi:signal peptidase II
MKTKFVYLFTITGVLIALDQFTKILVQTHFQVGDTLAIIPNFFNITYVQNPGAAFGFLAKTPAIFRETFFLLIPPFAMVVILFFLKSVQISDRIQILALSLVFGGALGNYIDRLRLKYVIDFIEFHYQHIYSYPAFNVADSAIVCGIVILFILSLRKESGQPA